MSHSVEDLNRRNLSFSRSKVREVLPEYFQESYPTLITFLEKYYDYLQGEADDAFKTQINRLFVARDPEQNSTEELDLLLNEIGAGLKSASFFSRPRLMTALLSRFYRVKGSLVSIEGFFRGFFGEEVAVIYPKRDLFVVGESHVGHGDLKRIQNNARYQLRSLVYKTGLSVQDWQDLYVKFVHPSGFYYEGELETIGTKEFGLSSTSVNPLESDGNPIILSTGDGAITTPFTQIVARYDSDGDAVNDFVFTVDQPISAFDSITLTSLSSLYTSVAEILTPNSFTFDDSANPGPDFSMSLETMDNAMYTRYLSDSTY